ncbi:DUF6705 family protein [Aquimarina sp. 2201CG5-10]|uniref:DUF6705 family protein n=1 Tax=Aquimarina callyspongiae TaxID=3098150 RepID=UPI002AB392D2|nr:DUF6705 family protein [Aquimarina sp. 2201CG5-10]MDY8138903.1 DUF6705 family protein [Aquimarina sp. 2201CG5-10]
MKKILKILIVCINLQAFAQTEIPIEDKSKQENRIKRSSDYYYKDINGVLDKFVGTWRYQSPIELFEITFTKVSQIRTGMGYYKDELYSRYKYIKNGQVIYDTYNTPVTTENNPSTDISGSIINNTDLNKIKLIYHEPGIRGGDFDSLSMTYFYSPRENKHRLNWKVKTALYGTGTPGVYSTVYKMPYQMTLTKVE